MKKRILAIALLVAIFISSGATTFNSCARASEYLSAYNIMLTDRSNGVVRISAFVNATRSNMTQIGFPTIVLYENNNGTWKAVKTISGQYDYNTGAFGYQYDYQGVVGRQYQAYASFMAKDNNGGDSREWNSSPIILK